MKRYLLCGLFLSLVFSTAHATDWQRLPDGRVVIEIRGERLAFSTAEHDISRVSFYLEDKSREVLKKAGYSGNMTRLKEVIENPALARAAFEVKGGGVAVGIVPPAWRHWEGSGRDKKLVEDKNIPLFLGKFDPRTLASQTSGWRTFYIWFGRTRLYGTPENEPSAMILPCNGKTRELVTEKDEDGFYVAALKGTKLPQFYCLPAEKRAFSTPKDLRIECSAGTNVCSAWFYGSKGNLEVGYAFKDTDFPKSDWRDLDGRMHEVYSYIIQSQELE